MHLQFSYQKIWHLCPRNLVEPYIHMNDWSFSDAISKYCMRILNRQKGKHNNFLVNIPVLEKWLHKNTLCSLSSMIFTKEAPPFVESCRNPMITETLDQFFMQWNVLSMYIMFVGMYLVMFAYNSSGLIRCCKLRQFHGHLILWFLINTAFIM